MKTGAPTGTKSDRMKLGLPPAKSRGDVFSAIALIVLVSLVARFAFGATERLPQAELTRAFGHGGSESLKLKCVVGDTPGSLDFCEITRFRNEIAVAALPIEVAAARQIVETFLKNANEKSPASKPIAGARLGWIVKLGDRVVEGKSTTKEPAPAAVLQALSVLESTLQTEFYK